MREGNIQVHSESILPVIKKWLYSDKDIFLREMVSNACDAISKLNRLRGVDEAPAAEEGETPVVRIRVDKEAKTLSIEDNGIGMTEDEVERYITQVAFSGAKEFVEKYKSASDDEGGIIGHFGLGFYSAFMVADPVEIDTLSYRPDAKPVRWASKGESGYLIGEGTRTRRGTLITLHITDEETEFLEKNRIREILIRYCAFMPYEIYLESADDERAEAAKAAEEAAKPAEEGKEEAKPAKTVPHPVNDTHPLWLKAPKDCTKEEYEAFYTQLFLDFNPPLFWIHLNVDYPFTLRGILYFPRQAEKLEVTPGQIKLYSNQVYIADNIKEVVPEFLLLLKGVIDCPDLPLNVSRSFLQNDRDVQKISKHITKKVADKLHELFKEERQTYEKYWEDIAPFVKYGCIRDESFYERVKDIILLRSINGGYKLLTEFPKDKDNKIYYVFDEDRQAQYIALFKEQGLDAAVLPHVMDSHFISFLEYKENDIKFARIDSDIGSSIKKEDETKAEDTAHEDKRITSIFELELENAGVEIKAEHLKNADVPAVMLLDEYARRMQEMRRLYRDMPDGEAPKRTLVLNLENPTVRAVGKLDDMRRSLVCLSIRDLAALGHGPLTADETEGFTRRSAQVLALAAGLPLPEMAGYTPAPAQSAPEAQPADKAPETPEKADGDKAE